MRKMIVLFAVLLITIMGVAGCAIHAVDVKTLTIPPQKDSVTLTMKGTATCTDYFLFYRVTENMDITSSNGQQAVSVK